MQCCHGVHTPCTFDTHGNRTMKCCQSCRSNLFCRCIRHQVRKAACVRATQALQVARQQKQKCSATTTQRDLDVFHADSTASVAVFLRTTELLSLVSSVGLQAYALFLTYSQEVQKSASYICEAHQSEPVHQPQHHMISQPNWLSQFAVCALILAYILGTIRRWVSNGRKHDNDIQPATSSTAGLAKLEVLADRQAQSLQALARQVTKVQLKTRLVGHDTKPLLRKVQQENLQQAEELAAQATQIAAVKSDLQDTQKLLSALQSVSAKQFEVVIKVLKQQQQQQKPKLQPAQAAPQPFDVIPSQHA